MSKWKFKEKNLYFDFEIHENFKELFKDLLYHRIREFFSQHDKYLLPILWSFNDNRLSLQFKDNIRFIQASPQTIKDLIRNGTLDENSLINAIKIFSDCHNKGIGGLSQFFPINERWVIPPSFFIRDDNESKKLIEQDLKFLRNWITSLLDCLRGRLDKETFNIINNLSDLLNKSEYLEILKSLNRGSDLKRASFLDVLTESEFYYKILEVYKYQKMREIDSPFDREIQKSEEILEIDLTYRDPQFGNIKRPSVQELWDKLMDNSHVTRTLICSDLKNPPNPLKKLRENEKRVEWINLHADQQIILIKNQGSPLPPRGYIYVYEYGDIDQIQKKRRFINYAKNHPLIQDLLKNLQFNKPNNIQNIYNRKELAEIICNNWGLFAVQGPPGTGKTYLATEVVVKFLKKNPYSKILVCSKEHLVLNYILKRIMEKYDVKKNEIRAFRSLSAFKQTKTFLDPKIKKYISSVLMKEIGSYRWNKKSENWYHAQESLIQEYDLRNFSLALKSATIIFCTTMDSIFYRLIDKTSFDLVIIEETGKCYPSELLHAICLGQKVLLIGDQNQLPPYKVKDTEEALDIWESTIKTVRNNKNQKLNQDLEKRFGNDYLKIKDYFYRNITFNKQQLSWLKPFEAIFNLLPLEKKFILDHQYRMEKPLSDLIGRVFYNREFKHKKRSEEPLKGVIPAMIDVPMLWIDVPHMTDYMDATEDPEKIGLRVNFYELSLLLAYLKCLKPGKKIDIVILTPYNDQKDLFQDSEELKSLCDKLSRKPFQEIIRTTDEYQGHEADMTILSLVRNNTLNAASSWGFIIEPERLNVMFSRTKSRQVIIGSSQHIIRNSHEEKIKIFHKLYLEYKKLGKFISAKDILKISKDNVEEE